MHKKCFFCGSKKNIVKHHISYVRNEIMFLCRKCHKKIHKTRNDYNCKDRQIANTKLVQIRIPQQLIDRINKYKRHKQETTLSVAFRILDIIDKKHITFVPPDKNNCSRYNNCPIYYFRRRF